MTKPTVCVVCGKPIDDGEWFYFHSRLGVAIHFGCPLTDVKGEDVTGQTLLVHAGKP